jgi:hypothetical protein
MHNFDDSSDDYTIGMIDVCWVLISILLLTIFLRKETEIAYKFNAIPKDARVFYRHSDGLFEYTKNTWVKTELSTALFALKCEECSALVGVSKTPIIIGLPMATEKSIANDFFHKCQDKCSQFVVKFDVEGYSTTSF